LPLMAIDADTHVDDNVADGAAQHRHQLALRLRILKMQPAQRASDRAREVVLHETIHQPGGGVTIRLKGFQKKATCIAEYLRLDDQHVWNGGPDDVHVGCGSRTCGSLLRLAFRGAGMAPVAC